MSNAYKDINLSPSAHLGEQFQRMTNELSESKKRVLINDVIVGDGNLKVMVDRLYPNYKHDIPDGPYKELEEERNRLENPGAALYYNDPEYLIKVTLDNVMGIGRSNLRRDEYLKFRALAYGITADQRGPEHIDVHDPETSLKAFLLDHVSGSEVSGLDNTVVFRSDDNIFGVDETELSAPLNSIHPFNDYTLACDTLNYYGERQYEFVRVYMLDGKLTMEVFDIDLFGKFNFQYRTTLSNFQVYMGRPRIMGTDIHISDAALIDKSATDYLSSVNLIVPDAIRNYMRVVRFIIEFEKYKPIEVVKSDPTPRTGTRSISTQVTNMEYTLNLSKSKRIKYEADVRKHAAYTKEEPKTREYERIGHIRTLKDGREVPVRGTTCNPGSPLGKVTKDYKLK